jgi:Zn-dependent protease
MSWKIGRVAGIDIYVHPTFLLVLALPQVLSGGAFSLSLVLAAFGCVLLHELGHALMARRFGIGTEDITLYPIGGVARLSRMPRSPGAELLIALAGPAVNLAIVAGLVLASSSGLFAESQVLASFVELLAWVNLVLFGFNLIPAFPMDGGRVLRALLSPAIGRLQATNLAAGLGRGLAVVFGIYSLLNGMFMQVFLAAFVYMAAGAERARVVAEESVRRYEGDKGVWVAPPGFRWVQRGDGVWQLAPIVVTVDPRGRQTWV